LNPQARKEQLLELGVKMLRTRRLDDLSIDSLADVAGISRGLLYHYFTNKQDFRRAVIQRAVNDLFRLTDPPQGGDPVERLLASTAAYVD
jgi:AcrR family transcriptional regulator